MPLEPASRAEVHRMLDAECRPIVDKTVGHFMAMTNAQQDEFVARINQIYRDNASLTFERKR